MTGTRVGIVGLGRLGTCLARALQRAGVTLTALASKDDERVKQVTRALGLPFDVVISNDRIAERVPVMDVVFVTVPDGELTNVSARLPLGSGQAIVHCSGALDLTPLAAVRARGASVGVFHPLQSFGPDAAPSRFHGVAVGIDGDEPLFTELTQLACRLGARPFSLRGVDRARYHAAAVFASNYLVALHAVAARIWEAAGLPAGGAKDALATLSRGALENIEAHPLASALTGPIARGDAATVGRHVAALQNDLPSLAIYRALARELAELPLDHAPETRAALERVLADALDRPAEG